MIKKIEQNHLDVLESKIQFFSLTFPVANIRKNNHTPKKMVAFYIFTDIYSPGFDGKTKQFSCLVAAGIRVRKIKKYKLRTISCRVLSFFVFLP